MALDSSAGQRWNHWTERKPCIESGNEFCFCCYNFFKQLLLYCPYNWFKYWIQIYMLEQWVSPYRNSSIQTQSRKKCSLASKICFLAFICNATNEEIEKEKGPKTSRTISRMETSPLKLTILPWLTPSLGAY